MILKLIHFLYFLFILGVSVLAAMLSEFFVVGVVIFAVFIKPIMNNEK